MVVYPPNLSQPSSTSVALLAAADTIFSVLLGNFPLMQASQANNIVDPVRDVEKLRSFSM